MAPHAVIGATASPRARVPLALVLVLAAGLFLGGAARLSAQDREAFDTGLERIEKLARRKKWEAARKALDALLEAHPRTWYARARRVEIENLARQLAFRIAHPEPKPQSVTQGDLQRFDERSGRFKIVYGEGEWRDFESSQGLRAFPGLFTGPHTMTVKGKSLPGSMRFVACSDEEHAVVIDSGHAPHDDRSTPAALVVIEKDDRERADVRELPSPKLHEPFVFKLVVTQRSVRLSYNGRRLLSGPRPAGGYGYLLLESGSHCESVTIEGSADPSWVQSLVDRADERTRARFRSRFKVGSVLPQWLYEKDTATRPTALAGNARPREVDTRTWPGRPDADARAALEKIRRHVVRREAADGLAALEAAPELPELPALWLRALFLRIQGRFRESLATLGRVRAADPLFVDAEAMEAGLMLDLHRFDELEERWFALLDRFPQHGPFHDAAAFDLLRAGRPARAKEVVDRALERGIATKEQHRLNVLLVRALKGPAWSDQHEIRTRHYVVRSNIDRSLCQEAARVLEQAHLAFKAWLPRVPEETTRKFAVYLFAGEASYQRYARDATGSTAPGSAGLFSPWLKQLLIWNLPDREQMMRTVRHEAFHQYLDRVMPDPPRWFNEGHAEYFETAGDAKGNWRTGLLREDHLAVLKREGAKPLRIFLQLDDATFMSRPGFSYAQSWSIVYFLHESGPRYAPAARRLFEAFAEGRSQDEAWAEALGRISFVEFEKDYRAWLSELLEDR